MYFVGFLKTCHRDVITEGNNLCLYHTKHINILYVCVCVCVCVCVWKEYCVLFHVKPVGIYSYRCASEVLPR